MWVLIQRVFETVFKSTVDATYIECNGARLWLEVEKRQIRSRLYT